MLINFVDATNDANHNTKPPPVVIIPGDQPEEGIDGYRGKDFDRL